MMTRPSIHLRAAQPELDEGMAYARYLDIAAEGFFRLMLGRESERIIARAYLEPGHEHSYENVIFAEQEGQLLGMACGFSGQQRLGFSDRPLQAAASGRRWRMQLVKSLFAPMIRMLNALEKNDFYLLSVATDAAMRGTGIGSMLIDAMEARAVASSCNRLALDVAANNQGARQLYERRGMSVESRWPRHFAIPMLTFYRMVKTLHPANEHADDFDAAG